ncbi:MAG: ElyC/SanA/YdcF family protein [Smithellaceae bacterium]
MKRFKKRLWISAILVIVVMAGLFYSPRFLIHSTHIKKVDAIILLLGPDFSARQKEAYQLIHNGMADYLIIPAYDKSYRIEKGSPRHLPHLALKEKSLVKNGKMPSYFEDTHLEVIDARTTMDMQGLSSAIFVSSPYHMRRIQLMVSKEFDRGGQYYFVPTRYEKAPEDVWKLSGADVRKVWREYIKIIWFLIYSFWTS